MGKTMNFLNKNIPLFLRVNRLTTTATTNNGSLIEQKIDVKDDTVNSECYNVELKPQKRRLNVPVLRKNKSTPAYLSQSAILSPLENRSLAFTAALNEKSQKNFELSDSIENIQRTTFPKLNAKLAVVDCLELSNLSVFFSSISSSVYSEETILKNDCSSKSENQNLNLTGKTLNNNASQEIMENATAEANKKQADNLYKKGMQFLRKGDRTKALQCFLQAGKLGCVNSNWRAYKICKSNSKYSEHVMECLEFAALSGHKVARQMVVQKLMACQQDGLDKLVVDAKIDFFLEQNANEGVLNSMLYLAKRILKNPNKNIEDERKAIQLLKEASRKNYTLAIYELSKCYKQGVGVEKDVALSYNLVHKCAKLGNPHAIKDLIDLFSNGDKSCGVTKDHVQSAMLKKKLAKSCLTTHMKEMEILAYKSAGVKK